MYQTIYKKLRRHQMNALMALILVFTIFTNNLLAQNNLIQFNKKTPSVELLISEKSIEKLNQKRALALYDNHLYSTKDDWVKAKFVYSNDTIPAEVRLKGDYLDHWYSPNIWSFKIKLKGGRTFFGMKKFALQHPKTRSYVNEWLFHKLLKHNGLIYLRYDFVNMAVNGKQFPIYAIEENFDKYLIEHNELREGVVFQLSNRFYWAMNKSLKNEVDPVDAFFGAEMLPYEESDILKNPTLFEQLKLARSLITGFQQETLTTSEVFDKEKLATFLAILDVTGYHHASNNDNVKFYFNPVTNYIEPIGYDNQKILNVTEQGILGEKKTLSTTASLKSPSKNDYFMNRVQYQLWFKDPVFFETYINKLKQLTYNSHIEELLTKLQPEILRRELLLSSIDSDYKFDGDKVILNNIKTIRDSILQLNNGDLDGIFSYKNQQLNFNIINHKTLPVVVSKVIVDGDTIAIKENNILQPWTNQDFTAHFQIPLEVSTINELSVVASLFGLPEIKKIITLKKGIDIPIVRNNKAFVPAESIVKSGSFETDKEAITSLKANQFIDKEISGAQVYYKSYSSENQTVTLTIVNVTQNWIEILDARYFEKWQFKPISKTYIAPSQFNVGPNYKDVVFKVPEIQSAFQAKKNLLFPWKDAMLKDIQVRYKNPESSSNKIASVYKWPYNDTELIENNIVRKSYELLALPFIQVDDKNKTIKISQGIHNIDSPVKFPKGYRIFCTEGTTLNLLQSAFIISYSPLTFEGKKDNPIHITSSDKTGMGIVVYNTDEESSLKHINFNNQQAVNSPGLVLTGMVSFYEADVNFDNCTFSDNQSEDILNIIRSNYTISNCTFNQVFSDALDCDFAIGKINNSIFENIGNDAIDISGQTVDIQKVIINNIGDKGISAGENCNITGDNITINKAAIAISAKDLSSINIGRLVLNNATLDYAVFQKKSEYGSAKVNVQSSKKTNNYLLENNSELIINSKVMNEFTNNVGDLLYGNIYGKSSK